MADSGLVPYVGKKKKTNGSGTKMCKPIETDDMTAILDMAIEVSSRRLGRPANYGANKAGLEAFINATIEYFEYVNTINANPDLKQKLIPDIESWAVYIGCTRMTINNYEHRGREWQEVISYYKNVIGAVKKQLALNYKIPPMVYVFDSVNNHNYYNSNEYRLTIDTPKQEQTQAEELESKLTAAGLIWDCDKQEYVPMPKGGEV
jgi:hypothetical protein